MIRQVLAECLLEDSSGYTRLVRVVPSIHCKTRFSFQPEHSRRAHPGSAEHGLVKNRSKGLGRLDLLCPPSVISCKNRTIQAAQIREFVAQ